MLLRHLGSDDSVGPLSWQELSEGVPTLAGLATVCSLALRDPANADVDTLSREALAILVAASNRGIIDIRGSKEAFDATERLLAVCVEIDPDTRLLFRRKDDPRQTVRFLEGFRQLCAAGLVMHHLQRDFSLTHAGYGLATGLDREDFHPELEFATEIAH